MEEKIKKVLAEIVHPETEKNIVEGGEIGRAHV